MTRITIVSRRGARKPDGRLLKRHLPPWKKAMVRRRVSGHELSELFFANEIDGIKIPDASEFRDTDEGYKAARRRLDKYGPRRPMRGRDLLRYIKERKTNPRGDARRALRAFHKKTGLYR